MSPPRHEQRKTDPAIARIAAEHGLRTRIAKSLGLHRTAVFSWTRVPACRVAAVSRLTGMSPHELRPDVFGPDGGPRAEMAE